MADPKKIHVRPIMVTTAGGATMLARIPYMRGGVKRWLPAEGDWVPRFGREGGFWKRRIAEGGCEEVRAKPSKSKKGVE